MRKNPHDKILKYEFKEQHLNTVHKSCLYMCVYIYISYLCYYNRLRNKCNVL